MPVLENYEELSKPSEQLLTRGFNQIGGFSIYSHLPNHPKFIKCSFKHFLQPNQKSLTVGASTFTYSTQGFSSRFLLSTSKSYKARLNYSLSKFQNASVQFDVESNLFEGTSSKVLSLISKQDNFNVQLGLNTSKSLSLAGVVGKDSFGAGLDFGFSWETGEYYRRVLALWYLKPEQRVVVKIGKTGGKGEKWTDGFVAALFWFRLNESFNLAAKWKMGTQGKDPESELGVEWKSEESSVLKGKIGNAGNVGVSMRSQVHPLMCLVAAGRLNVFDAANLHLQFSFRVKFNQ